MRTVPYDKGIMLLVFGFLITPFLVSAQQPCGNIIGPKNWQYDEPLATTSIANCTDPFGVTQNVASPYTLKIEGNTIESGSIIEVPESGITSYEITGHSILFGYNSFLFLHDNDNYRYVNTDFSRPTESDYRTYAQEFFAEGTDIELFISAALDSELYFSMDDETKDLFSNYMDYVDQNYVPQRPALLSGTYTYVIREYNISVSQNTFLERLFAHIIPTAYAQSFSEYVFAITFTLAEAPAESTGISDILFLPGIQASRLYTKIGGEEEKIWEPFGNDDVRHLAMTENGESIEDVYTKEIVDEIYSSSIAGSVYKKFIQHLIDIDEPSGGPLVATFPYDWRHDVFDIVENGTQIDGNKMVKPTVVLESLASLSSTKKVTLIAHSNGGLLAKAIMLKLAEEGKAHLVDKVIFIASPHIGTPKALATLLHGYDQKHLGGLIVDDEVIRDVMKNMPGVYGLLPSETYVSSLTEPLISFDDSSTSKPFRDAYGFTISNINEYSQFLNGTEGREDAGNHINQPSSANTSMLAIALQEHREKLDTWKAPDGVEVFNIVGTGLPTPKSIEYKEFKEVHCDGSGECPVELKIEPVLHFTNYGDETVVSKSANKLGTNQYIDMNFIGKYVHGNITESETTQDIIDHILHGSSTEDIAYVSSTEPTFPDNRHIYTIHSPARVYVQDTEGHITGRTEEGGEWRSEIPTSDYFEAGAVKYLIVPEGISYKVVIEGEGAGVYTHTFSVLHNETESILHSFTASITPEMIITYTKTGDAFSIISVDSNGDGITDDEMTLDGKIIEKSVTYDDLEKALNGLSLSRARKTALLTFAHKAEKLSLQNEKNAHKILEKVFLVIIQKSIELFEKKHLVTTEERQEIDQIISVLIK